MTGEELKNTLPAVTIWMAGQAVEEGVRSYLKYQREYKKQVDLMDSGKPYNFTLAHAYHEGLHIAAEVLWRLFPSYVATCMRAIESVAEKFNGYYGWTEARFDDFVEALEEVHGYPVSIRSEK